MPFEPCTQILFVTTNLSWARQLLFPLVTTHSGTARVKDEKRMCACLMKGEWQSTLTDRVTQVPSLTPHWLSQNALLMPSSQSQAAMWCWPPIGGLLFSKVLSGESWAGSLGHEWNTIWKKHRISTEIWIKVFSLFFCCWFLQLKENFTMKGGKIMLCHRNSFVKAQKGQPFYSKDSRTQKKYTGTKWTISRTTSLGLG